MEFLRRVWIGLEVLWGLLAVLWSHWYGKVAAILGTIGGVVIWWYKFKKVKADAASAVLELQQHKARAKIDEMKREILRRRAEAAEKLTAPNIRIMSQPSAEDDAVLFGIAMAELRKEHPHFS